MKEELISFETAKLAYSKGFRGSSNGMGFYHPKDGTYRCSSVDGDNIDNYPAPTKSLLQTWLMLNHKIWVESLPMAEDTDHGIYWQIRIFDLRLGRVLVKSFSYIGPTPDLDEPLREALKLI